MHGNACLLCHVSRVCMCMCIGTYNIHTYIHTHTYIYIYTYTYIHTLHAWKMYVCCAMFEGGLRIASTSSVKRTCACTYITSTNATHTGACVQDHPARSNGRMCAHPRIVVCMHSIYIYIYIYIHTYKCTCHLPPYVCRRLLRAGGSCQVDESSVLDQHATVSESDAPKRPTTSEVMRKI